ncbi:MAG: UbiD family decarboxylase, partial [Oscillospiraceae bacterium]|nr:UbiD family decarboxylase [Oscillospiraceae bacterium]
MAKDLRAFLDQVKKEHPHLYASVEKPVNPADFDVTAILEHMSLKKKDPLVLFEKPKNLGGEVSDIRLVSNVFATRERCALALDWPMDKCNHDLTMEFARLDRERVKPLSVEKSAAPVKDIVLTGGDTDLESLPVVKHYEMDLCPVLTMTSAMKDPDTGVYDVTFTKIFYKAPGRVAVSVHSPHLGRIIKKYEERNEPAPMIYIVGHHPAFYLGSLALTPYDSDDYESIGSYMHEPLRLVESETWGKDFMVPADAEIIIEGVIPPGAKEVVDPFGEVTKHYQAQCLRQAFKVKAVTRRKNAIYQDIFAGHAGHWNLGALPKEGSVFNTINNKYGIVKAVHLPLSGVGRFAVYVSIDKRREGDAMAVGMAALLESSTFNYVVVVDSDIDVFDEQQVIWALITMVDPNRDISVVKNIWTQFTTSAAYNKVVIDATKPLGKAFPARINIPAYAMERIKLEDW